VRVGLAIAIAGLFALASGCDDDDSGDTSASQIFVENEVFTEYPAYATADRLPCTDVDERANFTFYSLGSELGEHPLTNVLRSCEGRHGLARVNDVLLAYGIAPGVPCVTPPDQDEGGCIPPINVESSPACEGGGFADLDRRVRGVPSSGFGGDHVRLLSGGTLITISGDRELLEEAVATVRPEPRADPPTAQLNASSAAPGDLPPPTPGAIAGTLPCTASVYGAPG
jgi:hypothetical protein